MTKEEKEMIQSIKNSIDDMHASWFVLMFGMLIFGAITLVGLLFRLALSLTD